MAIFFHDENVHSGLKRKQVVKAWLKKVIEQDKKKEGEINIVFTDDEHLRDINKKFLSREYYTDIITFNYSEKPGVSGDIFISLERVKENARTFKETETRELLRVIVHGILHLIGYRDSTMEEKRRMREKENACLELFPFDD